jgi:hypothetical protein
MSFEQGLATEVMLSILLLTHILSIPVLSSFTLGSRPLFYTNLCKLFSIISVRLSPIAFSEKEELRENVIMDESQEKLSLPTNMYLKITYSATKLHYKFTSCLLVSSVFFL